MANRLANSTALRRWGQRRGKFNRFASRSSAGGRAGPALMHHWYKSLRSEIFIGASRWTKNTIHWSKKYEE
jgi:hypothetical protein